MLRFQISCNPGSRLHLTVSVERMKQGLRESQIDTDDSRRRRANVRRHSLLVQTRSLQVILYGVVVRGFRAMLLLLPVS